MEDNTLGAVICVSISTVILSLIVSIILYYNHQNELIASAIKSGADPQAVACAFDNVSQARLQAGVCMSIANRVQK